MILDSAIISLFFRLGFFIVSVINALGPNFFMDVCLTFLHSMFLNASSIQLSHWLHYFFLRCVFSNVSSNHLTGRMHSRIGCIFLIFHHCVFSNVSSSRLPEWMQSCIGCICLIFHHCVFSNVSSNYLPEKMQSRIGCICLAFLHCAFSNVSPKRLHGRM